MKENSRQNVKKGLKIVGIIFAVLVILSVLFNILSSFGIFSVVGGMKEYKPEGEIYDLELEITGAELHITVGEGFFVKSNLKKLSVDVSDGVLRIKESATFLGNYNDAVLDIVIPENFSFRSADIETGAGVVEIDVLSAETLELELGAGKTTIKSLTVTRKASIDSGMGELNINGGELNDMELEMGIGECNVRAKLTGYADIEMGMGAANIILLGSEEDYRIDFSKGLGSAEYNEKSLGNETVGSGSVHIKIDGGIGSLNVKTSKE